MQFRLDQLRSIIRWTEGLNDIDASGGLDAVFPTKLNLEGPEGEDLGRLVDATGEGDWLWEAPVDNEQGALLKWINDYIDETYRETDPNHLYACGFTHMQVSQFSNGSVKADCSIEFKAPV